MGAPWTEYRLQSLEFRNGRARNARKFGFATGLLAFNEADRVVAIRTPPTTRAKMTDAEFDAAMADYASTADGDPAEIMAIRYLIVADGFPPIPFCHGLKSGAGLYLLPREPGAPRHTLFLRQAQGRPFFSKEWTLRQVSSGRIDSSAPVFQFHGFRHEH